MRLIPIVSHSPPKRYFWNASRLAERASHAPSRLVCRFWRSSASVRKLPVFLVGLPAGALGVVLARTLGGHLLTRGAPRVAQRGR